MGGKYCKVVAKDVGNCREHRHLCAGHHTCSQRPPLSLSPTGLRRRGPPFALASLRPPWAALLSRSFRGSFTPNRKGQKNNNGRRNRERKVWKHRFVNAARSVCVNLLQDMSVFVEETTPTLGINYLFRLLVILHSSEYIVWNGSDF